MSSNDLPFFPNTVAKNIDGEVTVYTEAGITLRDYFAAKAMQAYLTVYINAGGRPPENEDIARFSYDMADAMLKAGKGKGGE
jgi:hypothetical protein